MLTVVDAGVSEAEQTAQLRRDLLDYCALDTLAMVELHAALQSLIPQD